METPATETKEQPIVPAAVVLEDDNEAKIAALESEKARLIEEGANYKLAYLKEVNKGKQDDVDEDEDAKMRRIAQETLSNSRLAEIAREQDALIKKTLKENKELKLAQLNNVKTPPAAVGTHSEGTVVKDTSVTGEQLEAFKARGWSDKDIERYKKNLKRYSGG